MAVAGLDALDSNTGSGSSITISSYTVSAGTDRILVVAVAQEAEGINGITAADNVTVTYGDQNMIAFTSTFFSQSEDATDDECKLFYLLDADIDAATGSDIVASGYETVNTPAAGIVWARSYEGVDQTTPDADRAAAGATDTTPISLDVTSETDGAVFALGNTGSGSGTVTWTGTTELSEVDPGNFVSSCSEDITTTGGSLSAVPTWTAQARAWGAAVVLQASGGGGGPAPLRTLSLLGVGS